MIEAPFFGAMSAASFVCEGSGRDRLEIRMLLMGLVAFLESVETRTKERERLPHSQPNNRMRQPGDLPRHREFQDQGAFRLRVEIVRGEPSLLSAPCRRAQRKCVDVVMQKGLQ